MITVIVENYKTLKIFDMRIEFSMRIKQYEIYKDCVAVFLKAEKEDIEFDANSIGGEIILVNKEGIFWKFVGRAISKIWKIDSYTLGMYEKDADLWLDINKKEFIKMIWNPLGLDSPHDTMTVRKEDSHTLNILNSTIKFPGQISKYILFEKFVAVLLNYMEDDSKPNLSGGNIFFANENGIFWQLPSIRRIYMSNIWKKDNNTLGIYDGQYDLWLNINTKEYTKEIWNPWGMPNPEKYYTKGEQKMKTKNHKKPKTTSKKTKSPKKKKNSK